MYELYKLGWHSFQQLCLTVTREILGQATMSFLDTHDGGRDGCFVGKWEQNDKSTYEGQFVIQCKFTSKVNYNIGVSDFNDELPKVEKLVKKGLCDIYIIMTNAGISGSASTAIEVKLKKAGVKTVLFFGSTWLSSIIQENKKLRRLVPRVYGLGDLSQILDERVYRQGKALLESLKDDLSKVVVTGSYHKAADALDKHSFVLLIGEPAAGKTTIASLLAMGALDQWEASTLKLETAEKVAKHWNPDDPFQFFWIDDAFGVTQYESTLVHQWNHHLPKLKAMLNKGAKIVMTSRDYIYNRARKDLKEGAFPLLKESQVVIDVHNLTSLEKKQILYNHIKMGLQPIAFRKQIKPLLDFVASLPRFVPETARRIADPIFTKNVHISEWNLESFVNKQEAFLIEVLQGLDQDNLAALALIYMSNDKLISPIRLKQHESTAIERLGSSLGGCIVALAAMKGSLVQYINSEDEAFWKFKHPTIGDAFAQHIVDSPELIEIYLQGSPIEKLMEQVTLGDVGLERAIVVHSAFFHLMLERLKNFTSTKAYKTQFLSIWGAKRKLQSFLANRCSKEFLRIYIELHPAILDQVAEPGLCLSAVSEVDLAYTLHRYDLLPEEQRLLFIKKVSEYAISLKDLYGLRSEYIRSIFKEEELTDLKKNLEENVIPVIDQITQDWKSKYNRSKDASDYMQPLIDNYEILKEEFSEDVSIRISIDNELSDLGSWLEENDEGAPEIPEREKLSVENEEGNTNEKRSIFDDVDLWDQ
jgi:hypothetical protein